MVFVSRLQIHPIKALDPLRVAQARLQSSGSLEFDRRWAFVDAQGKFINGKLRPEVHTLRAEYDLPKLEVALNGRVYSLERQKPELERLMSELVNEPVELREDLGLGFPDDTERPGPTFVSESSIGKVAEWFELSLEETRLRFRTNVEFGGVDAFWEDRLYGSYFSVNDVRVEATNACKRCVVPSRNPLTGEARSGFQKRFSQLRQATLPAAADPKYFEPFYRFAVNTRIAANQGGKVIRVGDEVAFPA